MTCLPVHRYRERAAGRLAPWNGEWCSRFPSLKSGQCRPAGGRIALAKGKNAFDTGGAPSSIGDALRKAVSNSPDLPDLSCSMAAKKIDGAELKANSQKSVQDPAPEYVRPWRQGLILRRCFVSATYQIRLCSSVVEHFLGKEEVMGSIPITSSISSVTP